MTVSDAIALTQRTSWCQTSSEEKDELEVLCQNDIFFALGYDRWASKCVNLSWDDLEHARKGDCPHCSG